MTDAADIVIAGGGPVGLALARALEQAGVGATVVSAGIPGADRPIALSHASCLLLERIGAWQRIEGTPIRTIHVSQRGGFGSTLIDHADHDLPALGHVVSYSRVVPALLGTIAAPTLPGTVTGWEQDGGRLRVSVATDGPSGSGTHTLQPKLLVLAEGTVPGMETTAALVTQRDYGQSALVARVKADGAIPGRAWERFAEDGPVALLPYGDLHALVWSVRPDEAQSLLSLPDPDFLRRLGKAFGRRAGTFRAVADRGVFPLELRVRDPAPAPRVLAVGNAAQTLHPVAGQGLNLGLRDAWELAELAGSQAPERIGDAEFVRAYLTRRKVDREGTVRATDLFVRLFGAADPVARFLRGSGLFALDMLPPARGFLARRMMFGARALP